MRPSPTYLLVLAAAFSLGACKAQVNANASLNAKGEEIADFDQPMDMRGAQGTGSSEERGEAALLGARQDLSYAGPTSATCSCLSAAVGQPESSSFRWSGRKPKISRDTQLVVALSSNGVACSDTAAKGASYWGHEVVGEDVVVTVENAVEGRPVAQGAIIPRPLGSGQVYVKAASKGVPYGKPLEGKGTRCKVSSLMPAAPQQEAAPSSAPPGVARIRTDEPDPSSTRVEIP